TLIIALSILKINITENTLLEIYNYVPFILSIIILGVLIILIVKLIFYTIDKFISTSGIKSIIEENDQEDTLEILLLVLRYALYIVLGLLGLKSTGINIDYAVTLLKTILYPLLILGLVLLFVGLRPYIENWFLGLYLKNMNFLRVGEQVRIKEDIYTIESLKKQGITLKGKSDFNTFVPYKKLYEGQLQYKEIIYDLTTLEKIKDHFLAQQPSYCGPASASMILKIFGYNISQEVIEKEANSLVPPQKRLDGKPIPGGTRPDKLIDTVERLTDDRVKGAWISIDKINDLKLEIKTWLDNKALIIIDYKKSFLFPEAEKAHYSVCLSIKGDELLILDPSLKKGGVYFADIKKVYLGMNTYSEFLKEKRGYIVFAPKGTTAYHRIEKGLIYSDPSLYDNLSNNMT
ncbi:MAG: C39 family peptidase, partial [Bacteroidales bacterium]|nr:C39 family peptidase [Bacteroidales bacterium]